MTVKLSKEGVERFRPQSKDFFLAYISNFEQVLFDKD